MGGGARISVGFVAPPPASANRKRWNMSARPAGPVALLLQSLGIAGLTMDTEIRIWGPFGNILLAKAPLHLFRSVILEEAANGTIKELANRRQRLAPTQGIDWALTRPLWDDMAAGTDVGPSKRHMLAFAAGGHWRQHRVKAVEPTENATCVLC